MKRIVLLSLIFIIVHSGYGQHDLSVQSLRTEYKINPVGIDRTEPRLSWQMKTNQRNTLQTAYEIRAALNIEELRKNKN